MSKIYNEINIVQLKEKIQNIEDKTLDDLKVLSIVDSFWGCSGNYIKGNLCSRITKYAGCKAWKVVMDSVYKRYSR